MTSRPILDGLALLVGIATLIAVTFLLTGCSTIRPYAEQGLTATQDVNDGFLESMEIGYCDGPTDGALTRRYGNDPNIQQLRNDLCGAVRSKHYER